MSDPTEPAPPPPWPRPHFAPGGGDPTLLYVVFGTVDLSLPLGRARYAVSGIPDGLELFELTRADEPDVFAHFFDGPLWAEMAKDGPAFAAAVAGQDRAVVLRGTLTDPPTLDYFRDAIGIVTWLLDAGGRGVYDPQMMKLWTPADWREQAFAPPGPLPHRHVALLASPEEGGTDWVHTRGMRKFGRPDLSVRGVGPARREAVVELVNRFIELQALGGVIPAGQAIDMAGLPAGGVAHPGGDPDDPDFNNVHVELRWPADALR